jgi:hypothetical protein
MFTFFALSILLVEKVGSLLGKQGRHCHIQNSEGVKALLCMKQHSNFGSDIFNNPDIIIIIIIIIITLKWTSN